MQVDLPPRPTVVAAPQVAAPLPVKDPRKRPRAVDFMSIKEEGEISDTSTSSSASTPLMLQSGNTSTDSSAVPTPSQSPAPIIGRPPSRNPFKGSIQEAPTDAQVQATVRKPNQRRALYVKSPRSFDCWLIRTARVWMNFAFSSHGTLDTRRSPSPVRNLASSSEWF